MTTTYTNPVVRLNEIKAAPIACSIRLVFNAGVPDLSSSTFSYTIGYFDTQGTLIRSLAHQPVDTMDALTAPQLATLRALQAQVVAIARARGEIPAGATQDDF